MKKTLLLAGCAALVSASALAQSAFYPTGRKWDQALDALIQPAQGTLMRTLSTTTQTADGKLPLVITCADAQAVADYITSHGYEAQSINGETVTATVPPTFVNLLGEQDDVLYVNAARQMKPLLSGSRTDVGAEKVQAGTGLDTPYDGTGVVVGIIDQGFEYKHIAFQNRVKRVWNGLQLTSTVPSTHDSYDDNGHATHVANIAAGSVVNGHTLHGMAPGADLVFGGSTFVESDIMNIAKAIKSYAEKQGQPWVINMSFGSTLGPHDGTTAYDRTMDGLSTDGGILVGAMGNSGDSEHHVGYSFTGDETVYLLPVPDTSLNPDKMAACELWSDAADGVSHLTVKPVLYTSATKFYPTETQLRQAGCTYSYGINNYNKKQYVRLLGIATYLAEVMGKSTAGTCYLMLEVTGTQGYSFHAWADQTTYPCNFAKRTTLNTLKGDNLYDVGEGAASVPSAIGVGSYNIATRYTSYNSGGSYTLPSIGEQYGVSTFSSRGPWLGNSPKPAVIAPGGCIQSAFSQYAKEFSASDYDITDVATSGTKKYYYGVMSGTSMACPAVTGVIALWLQANPTLNYQQVLDILKATSRRDSKTGTADENGWNYDAGYGKIDAYEGLKMALLMKTDIQNVTNSEAPVTLQKQANEWKVLFNSNEDFADIQVYSLNGTLISRSTLHNLGAGQEHKVDLSTYAPGVYVFKVNTTNGIVTRRVVR